MFSVRASPSLVVVDGPTPLQPPAKRSRSETALNSGETAFSTLVASQAPILQEPSLSTYPASMAGPSTSMPEPYPTQAAESTPKSKGKGKRKAKDPESPPEEKRAARFKPKCPQNIMDRVQRVWQQRYIYMREIPQL